MKQYKFISRSALSFAVMHGGRQIYVNFSAAYRNLSYYITTDESLAEKIRRHRWYRDGRIKEQVSDLDERVEEKPLEPTIPPEPKRYSIIGKKMSPASSAVNEQVQTEASTEKEENKMQNENTSKAFIAEDVTSFMEAKEFFITNYGVQRSDVSSKDAVSQLCKEYGVVFPNYPV